MRVKEWVAMCGRGRGKGVLYGVGMLLIGMAAGILISMVIPYSVIVFLLAFILLILGFLLVK